MSRLVDDLLDMSRITRGKIELRRERVELAAIVHQAVDAVRALVQQHGPRADGDAAAAAGLPRRRSDAAGAGRRQPAEQRLQVHGPGRPRSALTRRARRRRGRRPRARQRDRHRRRAPPGSLRDVHAGRYVAGALARRSGHRPDAREDPRGAARRHASRRAARASAAAASSRCVCRSPPIRQRYRRSPGPLRRARAAASWSLTTTRTAPNRWRCC